MVVHQYENIKKKRKDMVISRKQKKKRSKRWTKRSQTNFEWNIIQRSLFENNPHITCLGLYYHSLPYP